MCVLLSPPPQSGRATNILCLSVCLFLCLCLSVSLSVSLFLPALSPPLCLSDPPPPPPFHRSPFTPPLSSCVAMATHSQLTVVVVAAVLGDDKGLRLGGLAGGGEGRGVLLVAGFLRPGHLVHRLLRLEERHVRLGGRAQRHLLQHHTMTLQTLGLTSPAAPPHNDSTDSEGELNTTCCTITHQTSADCGFKHQKRKRNGTVYTCNGWVSSSDLVRLAHFLFRDKRQTLWRPDM